MERGDLSSGPHTDPQYVRPNGKAVDVTEGLKKLKLDNEEQYWESLMTLDFFETMAMNIRYKSITFEMVLELMGKAICTYWDMLSNHISEDRAKDDNPKLYIEFQTLAIQIAAAREIKSTSGYVRHRQVRRAQKLRAPDPATPAQETTPHPQIDTPTDTSRPTINPETKPV
jgi:hypothetical protein